MQTLRIHSQSNAEDAARRTTESQFHEDGSLAVDQGVDHKGSRLHAAHPRRACGHPGEGNPIDGGSIVHEPLQGSDRYVTFHEVGSHDGGVTTLHMPGDAVLGPDAGEVGHLVGRDVKTESGQVIDVLVAASARGLQMDLDGLDLERRLCAIPRAWGGDRQAVDGYGGEEHPDGADHVQQLPV
jgi:hypothetical protein